MSRGIPCMLLALGLGVSVPAVAQPVVLEQQLNSVGGEAVAVTGEWAFVGDPDNCRAYVFKYDYVTNLWGNGVGVAGLPYTILGSVSGCGFAATFANLGRFGESIATDNGLVVIGASTGFDAGGFYNSGRVFVFHYDAGAVGGATGGWIGNTAVNGAREAGLASDQQTNAFFGFSVAVSYDDATGIATLVVGAPGYNIPGQSDAGKVYAYEWDTNPPTPTLTFLASDTGNAAGDMLGYQVSANDSAYMGGVPGADSAGFTDNGAAFFYGASPAVVTDLDPPGLTADGDSLGFDVSLADDGIALLGGVDSYVLRESGGSYQYEAVLTGTQGGAVSQSGGVYGFGYQGSSVRLYYADTDFTATEDWRVDKTEVAFGRDISAADDLRVLVNGETNNRAYAYSTPCGRGGDLIANQWTLIGLPCDTGSATIDQIFGDDLGVYGTDWYMYRQGTDYSGAGSAYIGLSASDTLEPGRGYWLISASDASWQVDQPIAAQHSAAAIDPLTRALVGAVFPFDLNALMGTSYTPDSDARVMLANPFPAAVDWSLSAIEDVGGLPPVAIGAVPWFEGGSPTAYVYDAASDGYTVVDGSVPGAPREIGAGEGFFVRFNNTFYTERATQKYLRMARGK
ncbi:hypothetical protein E4634_05815 [Mangrovimicrobium sediminis]|uniref:Uncharacterized protein n=1 Tax=Mangrovimicrobium sediminis TaxID=2562682 RepID=A0A4Z0M5J6_9GAMM|nr:hypothetical protein [Haliea sp. SAOS-164]TGD74716.1 hypothetical protein E4634_05815 [Haliea sp. SAOS-164]